MTGRNAVDAALKLLNYTNQNGYIDDANSQEFFGRSLTIVNQIYADLWQTGNCRGTFTPINDINETIPLSDDVCANSLVYGVAMLMAQSTGDADNQAMYASIYNKRRNYNTRDTRIHDVLPKGCDY